MTLPLASTSEAKAPVSSCCDASIVSNCCGSSEPPVREQRRLAIGARHRHHHGDHGAATSGPAIRSETTGRSSPGGGAQHLGGDTGVRQGLPGGIWWWSMKRPSRLATTIRMPVMAATRPAWACAATAVGDPGPVAEGRRGGEGGQRFDAAADIGVDRQRQRPGGVAQPRLEGVAIGIGRAVQRQAAGGEGRQQGGEDDAGQVLPQPERAPRGAVGPSPSDRRPAAIYDDRATNWAWAPA